MSCGSADYSTKDHGPDGMDPDGVIESNWNEIVDNFDDMNLKETLLRGIYAYGFEKPSAIQQRAIMPCIKGFDVIAQAQSGTGKTATFAISILQQLELDMKESQALVLAPTRELAQQGTKDIRRVSNGTYQLLHTIGLHHNLVWEQLCPGSQEIAVHRGYNPVHTEQKPTINHPQFVLPQESSQHNQGLLSPWSFPLLPS